MAHTAIGNGNAPAQPALLLQPHVHDPPLPQHLNIVALETYNTPLPPLIVPKPYTYTLRDYERSSAAEVLPRIKDADIVISCVVPIRANVLAVENTPKLRMIAIMASGTDAIDLAACTARGIPVLNSPHCNTVSLAEHVASLYLATRRSLVPVMRAVCRDEWALRGSVMTTAYTAGVPPRSCRDETAAIIGYGGVGQAVEVLLRGLGMTVIVSGRRGETDPATLGPRVAFTDVLERASVIVVCCPLLPSTKDLIGQHEFEQMQPDTIVINVARGGIVNEEALVAALREGRIAGAGVDVFDHEPATAQSSPVVAAAAAGDLNLVITGHTAWVSASTRANYQRAVQENVERFIRGTMDADRIKA